MRTTIVLKDALLARAKRHAQRLGLSLSGLIEETLIERLVRADTATKAPAPFRLVTFGGQGLQPGVTFEGLADLEDAEEAERLRLARPSRANDGDAAP